MIIRFLSVDLFFLPFLPGRGQPCSLTALQPCSLAASVPTCASERAALGCGCGCGCGCGGRRLVPLRHALQQVVQAAEASRQVAQEALLPRAVLGRQPGAAHVGRRVGRRVPAGVAQRLVRVGALRVTNVQIVFTLLLPEGVL